MLFRSADSKFDNRFLKIVQKIYFLGKFCPETQECFVLIENWYIRYSKVLILNMTMWFLNFIPKISQVKVDYKTVKYFVLIGTWYQRVFKGADSEMNNCFLKPLSANPTKSSDTLKQFISCCRGIVCVLPFCKVGT